MQIAYRLMPKYAGQLVRQSLEKGLIVKTKTGYSFATKAEKKTERETNEKYRFWPIPQKLEWLSEAYCQQL